MTKILIGFYMILQFTTGNVIEYQNRTFDSLRDCNTYQELHDSVNNLLIGQYVEDKVVYKPNEVHTLSEIQHVSSYCKVLSVGANK